MVICDMNEGLLVLLIFIGLWIFFMFLLWVGRIVGRSLFDALSCFLVALELRNEWRKDVYERTGVLPGREPPKERKHK